MNRNNIRVSIGIPAYNEEANISHLLHSILEQDRKNFELLEIIVISDGSTDNTVRVAKSVIDKKIKVVSGKKRIGAALRQNQIIKRSSGDFLVLLNADILIKNNDFLTEMVKTFQSKPNIGIVAPKVVPLPSNSFFTKVLEWHSHWKVQLYESINNKDNIYLCGGAARGFSRKAYKRFEWPQIYGEDAFSYLEVKKHHLNFSYCKDAVVYFQPPQSLKDHTLQSVRFLHSKITLAKYFTQKELNHAYKMPKSLFLSFALKGLLSNPINALSYIFIHAYCKLLALTGKPNSQAHLWEISSSTKVLIPATNRKI